jgi:hypothetical protein
MAHALRADAVMPVLAVHVPQLEVEAGHTVLEFVQFIRLNLMAVTVAAQGMARQPTYQQSQSTVPALFREAWDQGPPGVLDWVLLAFNGKVILVQTGPGSNHSSTLAQLDLLRPEPIGPSSLRDAALYTMETLSILTSGEVR